MPNRVHDVHPAMRNLPGALRAQMERLGHDQKDVEIRTGVPQPQISRALNGVRKRLTQPMRELCRYADIDCDSLTLAISEAGDIAALLQEMVGTSAPAASQMRIVLRSLAPLLADYRRRAGVG